MHTQSMSRQEYISGGKEIMSALEPVHFLKKKYSETVFVLFGSDLSALCPHYPD